MRINKDRCMTVETLILVSLLILTGCHQVPPGLGEGISLPAADELSSDIMDTDLEADLAEENEELPVLCLSLIAVGDNLIHYPIYEQAFDAVSGDYDFCDSYAPVRDLFSVADIAFLNQEVLVAGEAYGISSWPLFNSPQQLARDMAEFLGVKVVNMASNHILDKGLGGMVASREVWLQHGVLPLGCWQDTQSENGIQYLDIAGVRLAFLAYTYGLNGLDLADWQGWHVGLLEDRQQLERDILLAREDADLVILSLHWGYEGASEPSSEQLDLAFFLASLNVDLVIGHHPHVLQPIEQLLRADGLYMPVYFSLGNFISNQNGSLANLLGGMAQIEIYRDEFGEVRLTNPRLIPLVTHYNTGFTETYVYPLADYPVSLAQQHGILNVNSRFSIDWLNNHLRTVIEEVYLVSE
ncbi:MAG: CapA family protein [Symbiobacteriaceae bacterium]|nr:CapA family protein [Symbiobacteriaceae bacterium]